MKSSIRKSSRAPIRITKAKVGSADYLYRKVPGWVLVDSTLDHMREQDPRNTDIGSVKAKVLVLNTLYYTNLRATSKMARHIVQQMEGVPPEGSQLVEAICKVSLKGKTWHFRSFGSKYCHFFVSPEQYPILDRYNTEALEEHLGEFRYKAAALKENYALHSEAMQRVVTRDSLKVSWRGLDHYLYLWSLWRAYLDPKTRNKIAEGVRELFNRRIHERLVKDAIEILESD